MMIIKKERETYKDQGELTGTFSRDTSLGCRRQRGMFRGNGIRYEVPMQLAELGSARIHGANPIPRTANNLTTAGHGVFMLTSWENSIIQRSSRVQQT